MKGAFREFVDWVVEWWHLWRLVLVNTRREQTGQTCRELPVSHRSGTCSRIALWCAARRGSRGLGSWYSLGLPRLAGKGTK